MCYYTVIKLSVTCIMGVLFFWATGVVAQIIFWFPDLDHLGLVLMLNLHTFVDPEGWSPSKVSRGIRT